MAKASDTKGQKEDCHSDGRGYGPDMAEISGVFLEASSTKYKCKIKVFDASKDKWVWVKKSTYTSDLGKAVKFRDELQKVADLAHSAGADTSLTRSVALKSFNDILKWYDIPEITDEAARCQATFEKHADGWLRDFAVSASSSSMAATVAKIRRMQASFGDKYMDDIERSDIQDFYNDLVDMGFSSSASKAHISLAKRIFREAMEDGVIRRNPAVRIKTEFVEKRRKDPFTPEEVSSLIKITGDMEDGDEWRTVILFGLCLGARIGDCASRKWEELREIGNELFIVYTPSKTKRKGMTVKVPVVEPLRSQLLSGVIVAGREQSGYITPSLAERGAGGFQGLSRSFILAMEKAGVNFTTDTTGLREWKSKSFHSFRHTLPSLLASAGVSAELRMSIVGHNQLDTHLGYTHADDNQMRKALQAGLNSLAIND